MLDSINDADWAALSHAYGPATDVPVLIRALTSQVEDERRTAVRKLHSTIYHQGDRFSASPVALKYLCELACSPDVPDRTWILRLITNLVAGDCTLRNGLSICDGERALFLGRALSEDEAREEAPRCWLSCYRAVLPFVESLLELCETNDGLRKEAAYLLGCFRTRAAEIAPRLQHLVGQVSYTDAKAALLFALHRLDGPGFAAEPALMSLLPNLQASARLVALMCLANLKRQNCGTQLVKELRAGLHDVNEHRDEREAFYGHIPWGEGFAGDLGHVVARLGHEHARSFLDEIAVALGKTVDGIATMGLTQAALRAGFAAPYGHGTLTDAERASLSALFDTDLVWRVINNQYPFTAYGLPTSRGAVGELLGLTDADRAHARTVYEQALAQCHAGEAEAALPLLRDSLRLCPHRSAVWANLAWALDSLERFDEAVVIAERGAAIFPANVAFWRVQVHPLFKLARFADCIAAATQGLALDPRDTYLLYMRACARARVGLLDAAITDVSEVVRLDPEQRGDIAGDTDFSSLRSRPEFQALLC